MLSAIENILNLLKSFFDWCGGLINDLINVGIQVGKAVAAVPNLVSWLPVTITVPLIAGFAIVAAYKILGREG